MFSPVIVVRPSKEIFMDKISEIYDNVTTEEEFVSSVYELFPNRQELATKEITCDEEITEQIAEMLEKLGELKEQVEALVVAINNQPADKAEAERIEALQKLTTAKFEVGKKNQKAIQGALASFGVKHFQELKISDFDKFRELVESLPEEEVDE